MFYIYLLVYFFSPLPYRRPFWAVICVIDGPFGVCCVIGDTFGMHYVVGERFGMCCFVGGTMGCVYVVFMGIYRNKKQVSWENMAISPVVNTKSLPKVFRHLIVSGYQMYLYHHRVWYLGCVFDISNLFTWVT